MNKRDPNKKFMAGWIHQDLWDWIASESKKQDRSKTWTLEQKLKVAKEVEDRANADPPKTVEDMC